MLMWRSFLRHGHRHHARFVSLAKTRIITSTSDKVVSGPELLRPFSVTEHRPIDPNLLPRGKSPNHAAALSLPLSVRRVYQYFQLKSFRDDEFGAVFDRICENGSTETATLLLTKDHLQNFLLRRFQEIENETDANADTTTKNLNKQEQTQSILVHERHAFADAEARQILQILDATKVEGKNILDSKSISFSRTEFVHSMSTITSKIDYHQTWPVIASMLLVGTSVGITVPAFPFVVQALSLSSTQYGGVVSAFAFSRMVFNIPVAVLVERHGRKPYLTYSLAILATATAGIGYAHSFEALVACRLLAGGGVAALSTGALLMLTDVSTPRNRATTIAPAMSSFAAGMALGPVCGGYLVDTVGLQSTFSIVGVFFLGVAAIMQSILQETKPQPIVFPWQQEKLNKGDSDTLFMAAKDAMGQWGPLLRNNSIRRVMIMNGMYWVALSGSQMTLLPLLLTDPTGYSMTATQVGQYYAVMSFVQIVGNPVFAKLADVVGKRVTMTMGCTLISCSMVGVTLCPIEYLPLALASWAAGSSMLSTAPVAYISDTVPDSKRPQALALLRTCGDIGFLVGASATGALADVLGSCPAAMQSSASLLLTATIWFAIRQQIEERVIKSRKKDR